MAGLQPGTPGCREPKPRDRLLRDLSGKHIVNSLTRSDQEPARMKFADLLRRLGYALIPMGVFVAVAWYLPAVLAPRLVPPVEAHLACAGDLQPHGPHPGSLLSVGPFPLPECSTTPGFRGAEPGFGMAWWSSAPMAHAWNSEAGPIDMGMNYFANVAIGAGNEFLAAGVLRDQQGPGTASDTDHPSDRGVRRGNVAHQCDRRLRAAGACVPCGRNAHVGVSEPCSGSDGRHEQRQACAKCFSTCRTRPGRCWSTSLIDAVERGSFVAEKRMEEYVRRRPDFIRHLDLAYFHELQQQPTLQATEAVRRAMVFATPTFRRGAVWRLGVSRPSRGHVSL